jgi:hypothetical protein
MFYNSQGQFVADTLDAYDRIPTDIVPAGGRLPFELTLIYGEDIAHYTLSVSAESTTITPRQDFEFSNMTQSFQRDRFCASADFRNSGEDLTHSLEVAVVLFAGDDKVINVSDAEQPDLEEVAGGRRLNVQICVDPPNQNVARYEWRAWGR